MALEFVRWLNLRWLNKKVLQPFGWRLERLLPAPVSAKSISETEPRQSPAPVGPNTKAGETLEFRRLVSLLAPAAAIGVAKCRVGNTADGGYVMLDALVGTDHALSFGIGDNVSWDLAVAGLGAVVHQYDHTVDGPPVMHPNFRFNRRRVAAVGGPDAETIASILAQLPSDSAPILKIDVEHDEWAILDAAKPEDLARFSQIVGEFHWFERASDPAWRQRAERVLKKLNELFQVVHVHGNNCAPLVIVAGVAFPSVLEVAYASRAKFEFGPTDECFPTPLDAPNNLELHDYWLGQFKF